MPANALKIRMKFLRISGWILIAAFVLWGAGLGWFSCDIAAAKPGSPEDVTGAIVVLTGGEGRIDEGLALFAAGRSGHLFITGVDPRVTPDSIAAQWSGPGKLPDCCISLGYEATNTAGNAEETAAWVKKMGLSSIRLVTSSYHLRRALMEFRALMPGIKIIPHPVTPPLFAVWSGPFWVNACKEYNKTIATALKLFLIPPAFRGSMT